MRIVSEAGGRVCEWRSTELLLNTKTRYSWMGWWLDRPYWHSQSVTVEPRDHVGLLSSRVYQQFLDERTAYKKHVHIVMKSMAKNSKPQYNSSIPQTLLPVISFAESAHVKEQ